MRTVSGSSLLRKSILAIVCLSCFLAFGQMPANSLLELVDLDQQTWNTCGSCGDSAGHGALAQYGSIVGLSAISEDGRDTEFWLRPNGAWENAYFWQDHPAPSGKLLLLEYEFDLFIPQSEQSAPQAIEWECQQRLNGYVYNFGWQAEYNGGVLRTFDYGARQWISSGLPFSLAPGAWHHMLAEYHTDDVTHTVFFDSITIDGVKHWLSISHPAAATTVPGNKFTHAFQLDGNAAGTPYEVYVDHMRVLIVSN